MKYIYDVLEGLCGAVGVPGVAGCSDAACVALELLRKYIPDAQQDKFGNVYGIIKGGNKLSAALSDEQETFPKLPTLLLDAHIDEVGMIVTFIDDKGFIKAGLCGGVDPRILSAQRVTVWGKKPINGVVCSLPPHLVKDEKKALKKEDIIIDVGLSKEQLAEFVSLGDRITVDGEFTRLKKARLTSRALDNRAGVAAILYALELMQGRELKYDLAVLFSSLEEVGGRGARIGAYRLKPDFAVVVDVSYGDCPELLVHESGRMGDGVMIGISPYLDREIFENFKILAKTHDVKHQIEVMSRSTGTNADEITVSRCGVRGGLLSIPLRNMHTPAELVDIEDIEATGRLLCEFCCDKWGV
ncbi:MAG: M42 family peptidase [Oscillospiraceae bacterium]|nr:M42 family peptidase [Oscillospiraceae bacterium]